MIPQMKRKLWENSVSLYGVHAVNYVVPITLLPYLARLLGRSEWGALAFAEAFANTVALILEYGFGLSAARNVAQCRDNPERRSRILGAVLGAQLGMSGVAVIATAAAIAILHSPAQSRLLPFALMSGIVRAMNPIWYFQARERIGMVAAVYMVSNLILIVAVLLLVRYSNQGWLVLALKALFLMGSCAVSLVLAYRDTPLIWPLRCEIWGVLKDGWSLFLFRGSAMLYTTANVLLLGLLASPSVVAWFAGAEKISRAAAGAIMPLVQAFYPRINYLIQNDHRSAQRTALAAARLTTGIGAGIGLSLWFGAPLLIHLALGPGFERSIPVLRVMSLVPPLMAITAVVGVQWMLPLKMDRQFTAIIFAAGALNVTLAPALARSFGEIGMASSVVLAEASAAAGIVITCWLKGAIFTKTPEPEPEVQIYSETIAGSELE